MQHAEARLAPDSETSPPKNYGNKFKSSTAEYKSLAHALIPDLPLLMHGSGDVLPEQVDPVSVATLARLIENYVASLVRAAVDAHDIFTDGGVVGGDAFLGPPPFGDPARGGESDDEDEFAYEDDETTATKKRKKKASRRKKRARIDYWDMPLPPVKRDNANGDIAPNNCLDSGLDSDDDSGDDDDDDEPMIAPFRRLSSSSSSATCNADLALIPANQGLVPLDLHVNERIRNFYVAAPTVMDVRSFIFPISHDAYLLQRVRDVQASRRAIMRDVLDPVMLDVMMEEGRNEGRRPLVDMHDGILGLKMNNPEGDKKKGNVGIVSTAQDKKKGATSNPEEIVDVSSNIVGAGILDTGVDPSWPGLNALSRGRLW
jgi:hypothetical protein